MADMPHNSPSASPSPPVINSVQSSSTRRQRKPKNKAQHQQIPHVDGTISDSVTNPMVSPGAKKSVKQRNQSIAFGSLPAHHASKAAVNGQQESRTMSVAGTLLPATPMKEQAYAGPTFQASPAPSSLPVPRFFSKSVPNVAAQSSLDSRLVGEKTPEIASSPEPKLSSPEPPRGTQHSPLDLFFKADKAEREQSRRSSSVTLSPEMAQRLPPAAMSRTPFPQSGKSIFLQELDGEDEKMHRPHTVPSKQRGTNSLHRATSAPTAEEPETNSESEREAYTRSLKKLLMNSVNAGTPQNMATPQQSQQWPHANPANAQDVFGTPSPPLQSRSGPSTPAPSTEQQNHYLLHYGNRNLSPLFKAARADTPPRPSRLRQQERASDETSYADSAIAMSPGPRHEPHNDPNSFPRNYLEQQTRAPDPANFHQLPLPRGPSITTLSNPGPSGPSPQPGVPTAGSSSASPRAGGGSGGGSGGVSRDIRTMEDDLRRMLKLNVLSN